MKGDNKKLIENFLSLLSVQATNYILPLITVPYLVRILEPEKFGLISFAQAFIQYFVLITDYGFNLSATREISISRENKNKISTIFSAVLIIKLYLMLLCFFILNLIVFNVKKFKNEWFVYNFMFGIVVGNVLFPIWFFQGMEKMKLQALLNLITKVIFTIGIFVIIKEQSDYIYVPVIYSVCYIILGLSSILIIFLSFKVRFKYPSLSIIKHELREGSYIFLSTIAISIYTISNTFILGVFTEEKYVGYYAAGEKIIRAFQYLLIPISQTLYPHINKLAVESKREALVLIKKILKIVGIIMFCISLTLFVFASKISKFILGNKYSESVYVIKILAFLPFVVSLSNILGIQTMITFGFKKEFTKILIIASVISIIISLFLVHPLKHIGISISSLIAEIFVTVSMFIFLKKENYL
jgi:PST family polysaccharide transporter